VIGSGIGGLSVAALLAKHAGKRVLVLERHYVAGGFTHTFQRPGYEWDVGLHYIGQVQTPEMTMRRAFDHLTEKRLQWNAMPEIYDRIRIAGDTYEFPAGVENFRAQLKSYFPAEGAVIDHYLALVFAAGKAGMMYFAEKAIPAPIARLIGGLLRSSYLKYARRTTAEVLSEITTNPELIGVLTSQWVDYGLPPGQSSFGIHAAIADHYLNGASYPVGGASEIAASIAPVIERAGGKILINAEVEEILLDQRQSAVGVRMADGREIQAKHIISDAGAMNTFARLLPPSISEALPLRRKLNSIPASTAHLSLYAGLRREPGEADFDASNLWVHATYDHDHNYTDCSIENLERQFPIMFFSFPSAKDPAFAACYENRSTIELIVPIPYRNFSQWAGTHWKKRDAEYLELKEKITAKMIQALYEQVPGTKGKLDRYEVSTPLTTRHFANYAHGEIYGLSAVPARYELRGLAPRTPIRNLFLTGQDVCSLGVSGALIGGVLTASAILGKNLMTRVLKG
jgi:all-trans-retinol 13,14-reductase